jgi:hypothetical protein
MPRLRHTDRLVLGDALTGAVAAAYILAFVAAIQAALGRLVY